VRLLLKLLVSSNQCTESSGALDFYLECNEVQSCSMKSAEMFCVAAFLWRCCKWTGGATSILSSIKNG